MILIAHRRNSIDALKSTPVQYGIEVDIRSSKEGLIIQHEPFLDGEDFVEWLQYYQHNTLILNIKEEGLESRLIELMNLHKISNYFFLDQSFPFLVKWSNLGERRCSVRVSEFESVATALALAGKIDWVWVDCFHHFPLSAEDVSKLQHAGYKVCLVSPELHGRPYQVEIPVLAQFLSDHFIRPEAICTKHPDFWEKQFAMLSAKKNVK